MAKIPRYPISKEAKEHLAQKLKKMRGLEKEKAIKRCEMYDRGFKQKKDSEWDSDR